MNEKKKILLKTHDKTENEEQIVCFKILKMKKIESNSKHFRKKKKKNNFAVRKLNVRLVKSDSVYSNESLILMRFTNNRMH